jgi:hypothetical protein
VTVETVRLYSNVAGSVTIELDETGWRPEQHGSTRCGWQLMSFERGRPGDPSGGASASTSRDAALFDAGYFLGTAQRPASEARDPFDPTWTKRPEYEPRTEQAKLGHLVEECNEIIEVMVPLFGNAHDAIQLVGKILRFGWDGTHHEDGQRTTQTNRAAMLHLLPKLVAEAEDVRLAAARMLAHLTSDSAEGGEQANGEVSRRVRTAGADDPSPAPAPAESVSIPKCSDCRHYWERRGMCSIAIDPADDPSGLRHNGPGRLWREPETCAPPWCPGFEAKPFECPAVHESGDCKHGVPPHMCTATRTP